MVYVAKYNSFVLGFVLKVFYITTAFHSCWIRRLICRNYIVNSVIMGHCATSRKVAGSISNGVSGLFFNFSL